MRVRPYLYSFFFLGLCACVQPPDGSSASTEPTKTLRDVSIPRDFTFRTSRTQRLSLQASDDAFGASNKDAPVIIARPDGAVLFRGAVRKGVALDVEVSVPTAVDKLDVTMGKQRSSVPLNAGGR